MSRISWPWINDENCND